MATGRMDEWDCTAGSSSRKANAGAMLVQGRDSFGLSSACFCQGASFSALPAAEDAQGLRFSRGGFPTRPGATDADHEVALRSEHGGQISEPPPQ